jgi:hypothetical protein
MLSYRQKLQRVFGEVEGKACELNREEHPDD